MQVIKRDGRVDAFDSEKIAESISAIVAPDTVDIITSEIVDDVPHGDSITSAELSNIVTSHLDSIAAGKYAEERYQRNAEREKNGYVFNRLRTLTQIDASQDTGMRENGNINADCTMGLMLKIGSDVMKHYYLSEVLPEHISKAHRDGLVHIHDLDFFGTTVNCLQINLEKLFENGFTTGHGSIRTPQSIRNYWSLLCIVIQASQNDMFGGQSVPALEYYLAPGVAKSFARILADIIIEASGKREKYGMHHARRFRDAAMERVYPKCGNTLMSADAVRELCTLCEEFYNVRPTRDQVNSAIVQVTDECMQGAEACVHNLCTMASRAGAQVPFSSVNYGTGTSVEQRMVIACMLQALDNGLGKGETQIFPIHVFKVKDGVNYKPGDPNYDLFRKAIAVTAHRMFPNYEFLDAPFNLQYYRPGEPDTEVSTMGCVDGESCILLLAQTKEENYFGAATFEDIFEKIGELGFRKEYNGRTTCYYPDDEHTLRVWDSHSMAFVKVNVLLRNDNVTGWKKITFSNGSVMVATNDHPLPVIGRGRIFVNDLAIGDKVHARKDGELGEIGLITGAMPEVIETEVVSIEDASEYNGQYSYDVETESDYFDIDSIVSHNCRTRVMGNINGPETTSMRGNLSFITINLPHLALESEGNIDTFFKKLDETIDLCIEELLFRFRIQSSRHVYNYPMLFGNKMYMGSENLKEDSTLFDAYKHGTLTTGFVGLAECLVALVGKHHGESPEAQELGLRIIGHMRERMDEATKKHHLNFSLIGSPAESTAGSLLQKDRKRFGVIPGVTDREYFTNSHHCPVWYNIGAKEKIELEAPYHALENGGHITYVEFDGDPTQNLEAVERIVRWMHDAGIGYGAINRAIDTCTVCGHTGIINDKCTQCGNTDESKIQRLRRVTGYLVGDRNKRFNDGKLAEERDRVKHHM